jgi:hypothetical protein
MLFDDEFVESITESPVTAVNEICERVHASMSQENLQDWTDAEMENVDEAFALLRVIEESEIINFNVELPVVSDNGFYTMFDMLQYIKAVEAVVAGEAKAVKLDQIKARFSRSLKAGFKYEFSTGDLDRIQTLITELREHISKSILFDDSHQRRLLTRLEKLQGELHKRMSDIDKFWGLIGDAGVAIGKFGNDAKPIVDRVREITNIVWNTQSRAEELPSGTDFPLLPSPSTSDNEVGI